MQCCWCNHRSVRSVVRLRSRGYNATFYIYAPTTLNNFETYVLSKMLSKLDRYFRMYLHYPDQYLLFGIATPIWASFKALTIVYIPVIKYCYWLNISHHSYPSNITFLVTNKAIRMGLLWQTFVSMECQSPVMFMSFGRGFSSPNVLVECHPLFILSNC